MTCIVCHGTSVRQSLVMTKCSHADCTVCPSGQHFAGVVLSRAGLGADTGAIAWYKTMEADGHMKMIKTKSDLEQHRAVWSKVTDHSIKPIGYLLSLEGADSLVDISHVEVAYNYGLRAIGPAHYGPGNMPMEPIPPVN
ncbi:hypothetical protein DdX_20847 [Ditylenchus destructor]|uniref:Uncharacterized protein n=1 Tax=Ditylenchus destructor TaxID=166010 RepID=A0AAD4MFX2_9BILA|nr:hypothetical protein DdX_20847 [Ditylenchus destructor]